ncbi:MAG: DUF1071 domain-containing protein [Bacteroidaceae bacterium]|nr:DUF1071 domain-containing protein [Bacteroidaceae bacterium]
MCKINIPEGATLDERRKIYFDTLYQMNLNDKCEKKENLTYLTWSEAWKAFKSVYPSASYRVICNPDTKMPYFVDPNVGIMVFTEITADELTYQMFLPVMNSSNRAMRLQPYTYQVWDKKNNRYTDRTCEAATMFDVNKTIMRCLVKNMSMFGLGLYIYAGEDVPSDLSDEEAAEPKKTTRRTKTADAPAAPVDRLAPIKAAISNTASTDDLLDLYLQHKNEVEGNPEIKALFTERKQQLKQAA